jgi:hypothetical protein
MKEGGEISAAKIARNDGENGESGGGESGISGRENIMKA